MRLKALGNQSAVLPPSLRTVSVLRSILCFLALALRELVSRALEGLRQTGLGAALGLARPAAFHVRSPSVNPVRGPALSRDGRRSLSPSSACRATHMRRPIERSADP